MPVEKEMLRLALSPEVLGNAKLAAAKEADVVRFGRAEFRETIDLAAEKFLTQIEASLDQAGFAHQLPWPYAVRPITKTTMAEIRAVADRRGVPCAAVVRALLVLMARTYEAPADAVGVNGGK